ncbi:retrotransposon protein, putative, ty1-copia subclass [Tanacetum coccineum]
MEGKEESHQCGEEGHWRRNCPVYLTELIKKKLQARFASNSEYTSQEFLDHLKEHGIVSQHTPPYTPQHNDVSEKRNKTLLDMVCPIMSQTTLPKSFEDYALEFAACILKMVPTKKVEKIPYKLKDQPTEQKRRRDDQDQDPSTNSEKEKQKRKKKDSESSKKDKDQAGSSKKGKSPSKSSKTNIFVNAEETVNDLEIDPGESIKVDVVDAEDPSQSDANEPTFDDVPKQSWFNEMVNAEKDPLAFDDVMGDRIPHDLNKPLPLHGAPGRLTILVDFFLNKDLDYLTNENVEKKYATSLTKPKAARTVIKKRVEDVQLGVENYQTMLNIKMPQLRCVGLDIKEHIPCLVYLNKDNNKLLMRANELYMFGDRRLKKVHDKLDYMLHNFELGYNDGMPKRAWTDKDKKRTTSMLEKI